MNSSSIKPLNESGQHSYHRRSFYHNYTEPFIYHIILKKAKSCERFGEVYGDARIAPGHKGCASIKESDLGKIIAKTILHLPYEFPIVKILQFCVMPDHVHILLQILYRSDKHLDFYIDTLRNKIVSKYSLQKGRDFKDEDIFEQGYCDKPLYDNRSLDGLFEYISQNPHRLAMRRSYPQFFQRVRNLKIGEKEYEAFGNLFLFRNPDKMAVKISRKFSAEEIMRKKEEWLSGVAKRTVLVSPFISSKEREIRREAEKLGGNIILIIHEAFPELYKPAAHDFDLCCRGQLLIISMGLPSDIPLSREHCLSMNSLASKITGVYDS